MALPIHARRAIHWANCKNIAAEKPAANIFSSQLALDGGLWCYAQKWEIKCPKVRVLLQNSTVHHQELVPRKYPKRRYAHLLGCTCTRFYKFVQAEHDSSH